MGLDGVGERAHDGAPLGRRLAPHDRVQQIDEQVGPGGLRALLAQVFVRRPLDRRRHVLQRGVHAHGLAAAPRHLAQELARGAGGARHLREDEAALSQRVIIRPGAERAPALEVAAHRQAVLPRPGAQDGAVVLLDPVLEVTRDPRVEQPIDALEHGEQEQQLLQGRRREVPAWGQQRVRGGVRDVLRAQVIHQVVHVAAPPLDLGVLVGRQIPGQDVDGAARVGKHRGDLLRQERAGAIRQREATVDRVVVGQRDEVHAALAAQVILPRRIDVALRAGEEAREPLVVAARRAGMNVQVTPGRRGAGAPGRLAAHRVFVMDFRHLLR